MGDAWRRRGLSQQGAFPGQLTPDPLIGLDSKGAEPAASSAGNLSGQKIAQLIAMDTHIYFPVGRHMAAW